MSTIQVLPQDEHNTVLVQHVHPAGWRNPTPEGRYNLVVVGAGTAGLITAAVAGSMGAKVALVERHLMGGDCLNVGCVPSKAIIRGARATAEGRWMSDTGLMTGSRGTPSFPAVMERLRRIRAEISHHDSAARYRDELGVDVYIGDATFSGRRSVEVRGEDGSVRTLTFSRAVISTGARAAAPPIPGLAETPHFTNETLFTLTELPRRFAIVGAGPIGSEMAQSFARLGSEVHLFELGGQVLAREDTDVAERVRAAMAHDGVNLHFGAAVDRVERTADGVRVFYKTGGGSDGTPATEDSLEASHLLIAIGRAANIDGLGLEAAGVNYDRKGVTVNDYLQTSNRRIYACGDVAIPFQFTHMAEASASVVVRNALFFRTAKLDRRVVPWCTYTSPEVARVGLSEREAAQQGIEIDVYTHELAAVDRARLDGETEGFVKLVVPKGKTQILGATIVAAHAGELIAEVVLAMQNKLKLEHLSAVIHPYPTQGEALKRAATGYLRARLTERTKRMLGWWFRRRR